MDLTPLTHPAFILSFVSAVIGLIVWLVRLEGKISANETNIGRLDKEYEKCVGDLEKHRTNADIHFNLRVSNQVEQANERRFSTIEHQLTEINGKLDRIAERQK